MLTAALPIQCSDISLLFIELGFPLEQIIQICGLEPGGDLRLLLGVQLVGAHQLVADVDERHRLDFLLCHLNHHPLHSIRKGPFHFIIP